MSSAKTGKGGKFMGDSEGSESSFVSDNGALAAAMATLVRAPHRDFMMVKQEWAAVRIQTLFRAFLVISLSCSSVSVLSVCNFDFKFHRMYSAVNNC